MKETLKLSVLCLILGSSGLFAQSTQSGGGILGHSPLVTTTAASYVGWDAGLFSNTIPLSIEHRGAQRVNFLTGGVQRMTILGTSSGASQGFVGINATAPSFQLDVFAPLIPVTNYNGINVGSSGLAKFGYFIDGNLALCIPKTAIAGGTRTNTFAGVGAGTAYALNYANCTYLGYNAGNTAEDGNNTFVGTQAGEGCVNGSNNVFMGYRTGQNNTNQPGGASYGTFAGNFAGQRNNGVYNVFLGYYAGQGALADLNAFSSGNYNAFTGTFSGQGNKGNNNVYNGFGAAGFNEDPAAANNVVIGGYLSGPPNYAALNKSIKTENTFVGAFSGAQATDALVNAAAFGANALVRNNNHMILGNNDVNVGIGLSNDAIGPQAKLEINTDATGVTHTATTSNGNPGLGGGNATGFSGVRFRDLTSASTPYATNPGSGVLAVDASGNIVYVKDGAGAGGGGSFPGSQNGLNNTITALNPSGKVELGGSLLHNTQVTTGNSNFEMNYASGGNISLGDNPNIYTITGNQADIGIGQGNQADAPSNGNILIGSSNHSNSSANGNWALGTGNQLYSSSNLALGANNAIGSVTAYPATLNTVIGRSNTVDYQFNVAIGFNNDMTISNNTSSESSLAIGNVNIVRGFNSMGVGIGVVTPQSESNVSIGNYTGGTPTALFNYLSAASGNSATAHLQPSPIADQVPAINIKDNHIGVKKYPTTITLDIYGTAQLNGVALSSDSTLKTNITPITNAMDKVKHLRPVSYEWINKVDTLMYGTQYGFTAQQVETVIPDLVHTDAIGIKSLNYNGLFAFYAKAIQEQQSTIDSMRVMMNQMSAMMNTCCQNNARTTTPSNVSQINVELSDKDAIVLNQNVPNPFAEQTTITYNIPERAGYAQILFSDLKGQIIKVVDIKTKGKGQLNVYASDLSTGMYTYSLYVDGKLVDTKKMVKTE